MPDRVVRADLERSEAYWALPDDTLRLLFRHLVNRADDYGNAEAGPVALASSMNRPVTPQLAAQWRAELAKTDIGRPYQVGVKWYVHIPKFRQRLRALRPTHPRPPPELECNEMKELILRHAGHETDTRPADAGQMTDTRPAHAASRARAESKGSEVKGIEEKRSEAQPREREAPVDNSPAAAARIAAQAQTVGKNLTVNGQDPTHADAVRQQANAATAKPNGQHKPPATAPTWSLSEKGIAKRAEELAMPAAPGERWEHWRARLLEREQQLPAGERRG